MMSIFLFSFCALAAQSTTVKLVAFDGSANGDFKELNDPVMGGKSSGTFAVNATDKFGIFDGTVAIVPSLKAPGFIKAAASGTFPDASAALNGDLVLRVRSSTPEYKGFRVTFASGTVAPSYSCAGGGGIPFSRGCFKAHFTVPAGDDFVDVRVPFNMFSDKWSPATGEQTSTCAKDKDVCPTAKKLAGIVRVEVWAEGALGKIHLEIDSISAVSAAPMTATVTATPAVPLTTFDGAKATTQKWRDVNDPVMGGKSTATFVVSNDLGVFDGVTKIVPSLKAPGFCNMQAEHASFPDASGADAIQLVVRSTLPYAGFKVAFGPAPRTGFFSSYKADFPKSFAASNDFQTVTIPFNQFSSKWSSYTGEPTTKCSDDKSVCPDAAHLKALTSMEIAAEGVAGKFHIEVKSISAVTMKTTTTAAAAPVEVAEAAAFESFRGSSADASPACKTVTTAANFNLDSFIDGRWYVQQQAVTKYLPKVQNNCVYAEYTKLAKKSFWGFDVQVHNSATEDDGTLHDSGKKICALTNADTPAKLAVGPCFLPQFLHATGPYWVLMYDESAGVALISGGQPTIQGPNGCRSNSGVTNGSGLWIFTRSQARDEALVTQARAEATAQGFDLSVLNDVDNTKCPK